MGQSEVAYLQVDGRAIAYRKRDGASPTLVFLPGYASDMEGARALALDGFAERRGFAMLRLDYSGTGSSAGEFEEGTLELWLPARGAPRAAPARGGRPPRSARRWGRGG